MQRILLFLIIVFSAITASAQPFGGRWMTAGGANGMDCLWFRRTFIAKERPYRAAVTVAADCRYVLYVNGRNVSTALYTPSDRRMPSCSTYDVHVSCAPTPTLWLSRPALRCFAVRLPRLQ